MAASSNSIRPEFHSSLVSQLLNDILYERENYYYFFGKLEPWPDDDNPSSEPTGSYNEDISIRNNILYARKISAVDVSLVTKRYEWDSSGNTVYDHWDDHIVMSDKKFYVTTTEYNVYKCLSNNLGAKSTIKPTGTSLLPFTTSDGYVWKYMYNVPITKRRKFLSPVYVPVQRALTDSFYSRGAVEQVIIKNPGSGYVSSPSTTINISAPAGTGVNAVISTTITDGQVTGVSIDTPGSGYLFPPIVTVPPPVGGTTAKITLTIEAGSVNGYTIVASGSGYQSAPTPTVEAPRITGTALAYINPTTHEIDSVEIINPGAGYATTPTASVMVPVGTAVSGKYSGNSTAMLTAHLYQGRIDRISIDDPGQNYPTGDIVTISALGDGTGAVFYPKISEGKIIGVIVSDPGVGYTWITLTVDAAIGSGAVLEGVVGGSDFLSDQTQVEQAPTKGEIHAVGVTNSGSGYATDTIVSITGDGTGATADVRFIPGGITDIKIRNSGSGYATDTIVSITGDGTGASAKVKAVVTGGIISEIEIIDEGQGYTWVNVTIPNASGNGAELSAVIGDGEINKVKINNPGQNYTYANVVFSAVDNGVNSAGAYAILPPINGHGADAPAELYAQTLAISVLIKDDATLSDIGQDYRQFGIIKNPAEILSKQLIKTKSMLTTYEVGLNDTINLSEDDILVNTVEKDSWRVVKINSNNITLQRLHPKHTDITGTSFTKSDTIYNVSNVISVPTFDKYSGDLLYVRNSTPITPDPTQSLVVRTYLTL